MPLLRFLVALLGAISLLPSLATGLAAQVEGETWNSPTYGFSVSWAATDWDVDPSGTLTAAGPERLDRIHLVNGISSLYFEGATRYEGNLSSCVAEEANLLAQESGVSDIRPYRGESGAPFAADGPNSSAAAFSLNLSVAGQDVELVDYVECRTLIPDEAVLIITLVTEPALFQSELAAAQTVIDTITQAEEIPLDPLAAYGGWIAAAQQQPSIAGPLSGELEFGPDNLAVARIEVDAPDAYLRAEFANPEPMPEVWDFGVGFRDSGGEEQFRLVVDSEGIWFFKDGLGDVIASGNVVDVDTSAAGMNTIEIVASGDTGFFAFNQRLAAELDLSARPEGGDVFVGAGFFAEDAASEATTVYSNVEVWSLAGIEPDLAALSSIVIDESTFASVLAESTVGAPAGGPDGGSLVQAVGSATVMPIGVDLESFAARVDFVNPSAASEAPWDFGIAFREQENGDHYRLTVASDGSWEFQIGLQAELAGGTVPSLDFESQERNTLEIVVAGDSAAFAVNGDFVSALDTSQIGGASDVWIGTGFHQANVVAGESTGFENFSVWTLAETAPAATPAATAPDPATPVPLATPVAGSPGGGDELALRLHEHDESGIDALAVLVGNAEQTRIAIAARDAAGGEVVVVHEGGCSNEAALPAFLLGDLDAAGRSETTISAPLSELTDGAHAIAIHRSAEAYDEIVACGEIPAA